MGLLSEENGGCGGMLEALAGLLEGGVGGVEESAVGEGVGRHIEDAHEEGRAAFQEAGAFAEAECPGIGHGSKYNRWRVSRLSWRGRPVAKHRVCVRLFAIFRGGAIL